MWDGYLRTLGINWRGARVFGVLLAIAIIATGVVAAQPPTSAEAISGSQFDPGNIIGDAAFYNSAAMSEAEIQSFLDAKIGACTNGACLNVLVTNVDSRARTVSSKTGNVRCEEFQGGLLSAATIIYRAQVACGISAKVILVTLQKEQGLVTKRAPSQSALDRAMGMACPDTAPCAPTSLGFGNQIFTGTQQLKTYKASNFGMQPGSHDILWNPNSACGSSTVNVQNYATAALYNYTPYQPNAAALANLGGLGDGCSSYGNRNFWVYFDNWFGPTIPPDAALFVLSRDVKGGLWMYPGTGNNTWSPRVQVGSGWDAFTAIVRAGDFNGDGHEDVLARDSTGALWMYPRDGNGGWLPRSQVGSGWNVFSSIFGVGDFNGDGHPDVMARDTSGVLWLYPGDGSGGWLPRVQMSSGWSGMTAIFGTGDFDGDGHPDVLARDASGVLWLYPGNGSGAFLPRVKVGAGWDIFTSILGVSDFNGDGHPDVMAWDAAGTLLLYPGNGKGGWLPEYKIGAGWNEMPTIVGDGVVKGDTPPAAAVLPPTAPTPPVPSVDPALFVLARENSGALWMYPGAGNGGWSARLLVGSGWSVFTSLLRVGDFNGDGYQDVLARDSAGALWLYPRNGKGDWSPRVQVGSGWNVFDTIIAAGDFSGDGHPDVLARDGSGGLWLYPSNGTGDWLPRVQVGSGWNVFTSIVGVGDFDGDGHPDVMACDAAGIMWLYPGDGHGGWAPRVKIGAGWNIFSTILGSGDFNGDGHPDVLARDSSGDLWLYPGNGHGGWLPESQIGSGWNVMTSIF